MSPEEAKIFIENLQFLNPSVFDCDEELTKSLIKMPKTDPSKPERIGVVLLSQRKTVFTVIPSFMLDLTEMSWQPFMITVMDQFRQSTTQKRGYSYQQHYGYHTNGDNNEVMYDSDCLELPYFMCSRETACSMEILRRFDVECLIGQISYKQSAEIYNSYNGYECKEDLDK